MTTTQLASSRLYIDGDWVDGSSEDALDVINPATEQVIAQVPQASVADVDRAVAAARRAFDEGPWPRMTPRERSDVLVRFTEAITDRRAELVDLIIGGGRFGAADRRGDAVRHRPPLHRLVRRARGDLSRTSTRSLPQVSRARPRPGRHPQGADRRGGGDHAVQLPAVPEPGEGRAGARGRQHRGAQAVALHAARGPRARRDRRRRRVCRPACSTSSPATWPRASTSPPTRASTW